MNLKVIKKPYLNIIVCPFCGYCHPFRITKKIPDTLTCQCKKIFSTITETKINK